MKIVYVGNKQCAFDNVARSGKCWNGKGDVQEVTDDQARLLLKYPDQWALADKADRAAVSAPVSIEGEDEDGKAVTLDPDDLKKPLEKMSKVELMAFAKQSWGKRLEPLSSRKAMIDQIEEWQREIG